LALFGYFILSNKPNTKLMWQWEIWQFLKREKYVFMVG
jgi:hypothetical protein